VASAAGGVVWNPTPRHQTNLEVIVKRRIYTAGAAVTVVSLVVGVGVALAATTTPKHKHHQPVAKPKVVFLKCNWSLSTVPPQGQASVDQPPTQGDTYGSAGCPALGSGVVHTSFTVPDDGDTVGTFTQYLGNGTLSGAFDITPNDSPPISATGFYTQTWTGKMTLARTTGMYAGDTGKKGTGVLNCATADSGVHMTCTGTIKVVVPPPATTTSGTGTTAPSVARGR
jgi:hypothetical protein